MPKNLPHSRFWQFALKFLAYYSIIYLGTLAIIGLSAKGGYYSQFIHDHLDYITWLRGSILKASDYICKIFGYDTYIENKYILKSSSGEGIRMVYSCIGYGIMSFWVAFILANKGSIKTKSIWIITGLGSIFLINVLRVSFLLISLITDHHLPFNLDHHTIFNLIAYFLIFTMVYYYDKKVSLKNNQNDKFQPA